MSCNSHCEARLEPFDQKWSEIVLAWVTSPEELLLWSARTDFPLTDASVFNEWHSDPEVSPYVLLAGGQVVAYGEAWLEAEGSVEVARLIVEPRRRRQGFGTLLIEGLASIALDAGCREVWVRVLPMNVPAQGCYDAAGFRRVGDEKQKALNAGQRFPFVWMVRRSSEVLP